MAANRWDEDTLYAGFMVGLIVGGVVAFFRGPRVNVERGVAEARQQITLAGDTLRETVEAVVPVDPVTESLAEGKAAARRRRSELGLQEDAG